MSTATSASPVYWDPYRRDLAIDPYPMFRRMREETPVYYNEEYDFYALSRLADVETCFRDRESFSSAHGDILEFIKAKATMPDAVFIHQDPPKHTAYRSLMQRIITPKRMFSIEQDIRRLTAQALDPLVGSEGFDFILDLGAQVPMRAISMLLGIPEQDQEAIRESVDARLRTETGKPIDLAAQQNMQEQAMANFAEYIRWREKHPSDDMMTELLQTEFKDPSGVMRRLTHEEIVAIVNVIAGAGNETTNRLIGWMGKTLAEHPDQRRDLVNNPGLIPQAIEELLRFEPPGPAIAREVVRDLEIHGTRIPAGSAMIMLVASANRDASRFVDGDRFDIHREARPHMGFGHGIHVCIGAPLARLEGRVVLEEVLKRFPEWDVDLDNAELSSTSTVRGWDTLPAWIGKKPANVAARTKKAEPAPAADDGAPVDLEGSWNITVKGPTGPMPTVLTLKREGNGWSGTQSGEGATSPILEFKTDGKAVSWQNKVTSPMKLTVTFTGERSGNTISGKAKAGFMGAYPFTGVKA